MILRDFQRDASDAVVAAWREAPSTLIVLPTGCHDLDQEILLYDGRLQRARDIRQGEWLMGPDSEPRTVLKIHTGKAEMYCVTPVKGDPFIVTWDHVLTLVRTAEDSKPRFPCQKRAGELVDISVSEWLRWPKWRKHIYKLVRAPVEFRPVHMETWWFDCHPHPYLIGALLGDGSFAKQLSFTTADEEVRAEVARHLDVFGLQLRDSMINCGKATCWRLQSLSWYRHHPSNFRRWLRAFDLDGRKSGNKHIPMEYKTGTREDRLELLAGLMDTDGSRSDGGYDFVSKSRRLAEDVAFVARSVGLAAYVKPTHKTCQTGNGGWYYRVSISGHCSIIPCRVPRKRQSTRLQKKDVLRTGFTVTPVGKRDYVGFTVDHDHRYLLGDFTVTHNCGKTVVFADLIRRMFPRRALVLAHRRELIFQACDKIHRVTGLKAGVEMANYRTTPGVLPPVVVSSIQTQTGGGDGSGRMSKFDPSKFGLLIIDECHHAAASSYRRVIDYYRQNPNLLVLGVTATPDRADKEALGQVFGPGAFDYKILDAIRDGWLVPIDQQMVSVSDLDFSQIRTTAGDLNGADLARVMEDEKALHSIASPAIEIIGQRRTLAFTASIAHAERLSEIFNRHRSGMANWVSGETDEDKRREILRAFAGGSTQVICNCSVFNEGFDEPEVQVVLMGRPTKSRSRYAQEIGRATRPLPGVVDGPPTADERKAAIAASLKPSMLVVDFVGNSGKHKLITSADILGGKVSEEVIEAAVRHARETGQPVRMDKELDDQAAIFQEQRRAEAARRARLVVGAKWRAQAINPFDAFQIEPAKVRGWDAGRQLSEKQRSLLQKQGIDPDSIPFGQARQLISELFRRWDGNLCSFKQAAVLRKHGYDTNVSRDEASALIDGLAKNGWRRPVAAKVEAMA